MTIERTLSIIKPDAVADHLIGKIISRIEESGLKVIAAKMLHLSAEQGGEFYDVHKGRPFYNGLVEFISSGPIMVMVLEGENAILAYRELMGVTDPTAAAPNTLRANFARDISHNAVHGSDAPETAKREIAFFFSDDEIFGL